MLLALFSLCSTVRLALLVTPRSTTGSSKVLLCPLVLMEGEQGEQGGEQDIGVLEGVLGLSALFHFRL